MSQLTLLTLSTPLLTPEALMNDLRTEFARLNATYFEDRLTEPEIVLSRRKAYGGYYRPKVHRIVLSWQAYEEHGWEEVLNTFRHEVAHIVHLNHAKAFWDLAYSLGVTKKYAAKPLTPPQTPHKYVYACPICERRVYRNRRIRRASCGSCDKSFNPAYTLRLVKSP